MYCAVLELNGNAKRGLGRADNAGNPFPVGLNYPIVDYGTGRREYHFPLLGCWRNSQLGGPHYTLLNPPDGLARLL